MHILVVDDETAVRDSLRRALELERYTVDLMDGQAALEFLAEATVDAIILDELRAHGAHHVLRPYESAAAEAVAAVTGTSGTRAAGTAVAQLE